VAENLDHRAALHASGDSRAAAASSKSSGCGFDAGAADDGAAGADPAIRRQGEETETEVADGRITPAAGGRADRGDAESEMSEIPTPYPHYRLWARFRARPLNPTPSPLLAGYYACGALLLAMSSCRVIFSSV